MKQSPARCPRCHRLIALWFYVWVGPDKIKRHDLMCADCWRESNFPAVSVLRGRA